MNMIIGYLMTTVGGCGCLGTIFYIMNDHRYSYKSPFSSHEMTMMWLAIISFVIFVIGIMVIIFSVIKNKNQQKLNSLTNTFNGNSTSKTCPTCHLNLSDDANSCPKCGHKF